MPMYETTLPNAAAGPFGGTLVVSMRPYEPEAVDEVARLTGAFPAAHGAPVHWGDPAALGIRDLGAPDFGDAVTVRDGEVPVFWACGVTPQSALAAAKRDARVTRPERVGAESHRRATLIVRHRLPLAVTHAPGHMFLCDLQDEALRA